jgi:drug/metabolite transporter (DMT)-like permease
VASILLALGAALAWGISDFFGGQYSRRLALVTVLLISQAIGLAMLLGLALLLAPANLDPRSAVFAMGASAFGMIGIAAFYRGMAIGVVSIVAPISATGAAIPVVFGLVRGEAATVTQLGGIGLAMVGIILASRVAREPRSSTAALVSPGVGLALVAAIGFGFFFVLLREASTRDVLWAGVVQRATGLAIIAVAAAVLRPALKPGWRRLPGLIVVGVLDTAANVLFAFASTTGLISLTAVLVSLYPIVTVLLARVVLHERLTPLQGGGVLCALAGVGLIAAR